MPRPSDLALPAQPRGAPLSTAHDFVVDRVRKRTSVGTASTLRARLCVEHGQRGVEDHGLARSST